MLGLAFAPDFAKTHRFWVAYTTGSGSLRMSRFTASSAWRPRVSRSTERVLLTIPHPDDQTTTAACSPSARTASSTLTTGDGGGGGDPFRHAQNRQLAQRQDPAHRRAPVLRRQVLLHPRVQPLRPQSSAYRKRQIWAYGVRNVWRFSVDRATGGPLGRRRRPGPVRGGHPRPCGQGRPQPRAGRAARARHVFNASRCHSGRRTGRRRSSTPTASVRPSSAGTSTAARAYAKSLLRGAVRLLGLRQRPRLGLSGKGAARGRVASMRAASRAFGAERRRRAARRDLRRRLCTRSRRTGV